MKRYLILNVFLIMAALQLAIAPGPVVNPFPANAQVEVDPNAILTWEPNPEGGTPSGYRLYLGTNRAATNIFDGLETDMPYFDMDGYNYDTKYYWRVVAYNIDGDAEGSATWNFTTFANPEINRFPYTQGFNAEPFPAAGWSMSILAGMMGYSIEPSSTNPNCAPHSGAGMLVYHGYGSSYGDQAVLFSSAIRTEYPQCSYQVGFWIYRDNESALGDQITVYRNSAPALNGNQAPIVTIHRAANLSPLETGGTGWYYYSYNFYPTHPYTYLIFLAFSYGGLNMYMDGLTVTRTVNSGAYYDIWPGDYNFGEVVVNTSKDKTFVIGNSGVDAFTLNQIREENGEGQSGLNFSLPDLPTLPAVIDPGDSIQFTLRYSPLLYGNYDETYLYITSSLWPSKSYIIGGVGVNEAAYTINPGSYAFGNVPLYTTAWVCQVIKNTGDLPLTVMEISLDPQTVEHFTLQEVPALPRVIEGGDSLYFFVHYMPTETGGGDEAVLHIAETGDYHTYMFNGTGITQPDPAIYLFPPDGSVNTSLNPVLKWSKASTGCAPTGFLVYVWTEEPYVFIENGVDTADTSYVVHSLANGTLYYWQIIPYNAAGNAADVETWSFTTVDAAFEQTGFFAAPTTGHAPLLVNFADSTQVGALLPGVTVEYWYWDFDNDGTTDSFEQNPSHTYEQPGSYSVRLTVICSNGMTASYLELELIDVTNQDPAVTSYIEYVMLQEDTPDSSIILDAYFADGDEDPLAYSFSGNIQVDAFIRDGRLNLIPALNWSGMESILLTATDPFGAYASQSVDVMVSALNDPPAFALPDTLYFLAGTAYEVDFSEYFADPDNTYEQLSMLIDTTSTAHVIHCDYIPNTEGELTCEFSAPAGYLGIEVFPVTIDDNAARATAQDTIVIKVLADLEPYGSCIVPGGTRQNGYTGQQVFFTDATKGNPDYWSWDFGDGYTSSSKNTSHKYLLPGTYTIHLTVDNSQDTNPQQTVNIGSVTMIGTLAPTSVVSSVNWLVGDHDQYNIFDSLYIAAGGSLTISPLLWVNVFDTTRVIVNGAISASNVQFRPQGVFTSWKGLTFNASAQASNINCCFLYDALEGFVISNGNVEISQTSLLPSDSLTILNGTAVTITGACSPTLSDIVISNYKTGFSICGTGTGNTTTPTLTNIRVRNSTNASRSESIRKAILINETSSPVIDGAEIINYDKGISFYNSNLAYKTNPSITGCQIYNEAQSTDGMIALEVNGNVCLNVDSLYIDRYETGVVYQSYGSSTSTPTLTNIRVRNSTNATRGASLGVLLDNVRAIEFTNSEIDSMLTGIKISNNSGSTSVPAFSNVRVSCRTGSSVSESVGLEVSGNVSPQFNDLRIDNYIRGISYLGSGTSLYPIPTLSNIRIRKNGQALRLSASTGMKIHNVPCFVAINDTIEGYSLGLEVTTDAYSTRNTPTLTNIRIRNSTNASRQNNTGILLGEKIAGTLNYCLVEEYFTGVFLADDNRTTLMYNLIKNCGIGLKASGYTTSQPISRNLFKLDPSWQATHAWEYKPILIYSTGPWNIHHNTVWGFPLAMSASYSNYINFSNNVVWDDNIIQNPFSLNNATMQYTYNDVRISGEFAPGSGNFNSDPLLSDPEADDFQLTYNSPCIDGGDPAFQPDADNTVTDVGAYPYLHKADFTPHNSVIMVGETISFYNLSLGHDYPGFTSVAWDLGNNGSVESTDWNWSHQFNQSGIFALRLVVTTGNLADTLVINDAVEVEEVKLKAPQSLLLAVIGSDMVLSWDAVTQNQNGQPVQVGFYIIYSTESVTGTFSYIGYTDEGSTVYTDTNGAWDLGKFYLVIGFAGTYTEFQDFLSSHPVYPLERSMLPDKPKYWLRKRTIDRDQRK